MNFLCFPIELFHMAGVFMALQPGRINTQLRRLLKYCCVLQLLWLQWSWPLYLLQHSPSFGYGQYFSNHQLRVWQQWVGPVKHQLTGGVETHKGCPNSLVHIVRKIRGWMMNNKMYVATKLLRSQGRVRAETSRKINTDVLHSTNLP